ncbi:MAG: hypothetical protein U1G07_03715 [Verrucomicrobiota bacterium]
MTPNAVLAQSFATIPRPELPVSVDLGVHAFNTLPQRMRLLIEGDRPLLDYSIPPISHSATNYGMTEWTPHSFTFVADSHTTTITFRTLIIATSTIGVDLALDNVSVSVTGQILHQSSHRFLQSKRWRRYHRQPK